MTLSSKHQECESVKLKVRHLRDAHKASSLIFTMTFQEKINEETVKVCYYSQCCLIFSVTEGRIIANFSIF